MKMETTWSSKKILKIGALLILSLFIIFYAFFISRDLIFGVKIKNVNITDGAKMTNNVVQITGNAKNAVSLTLNDRAISVDQQGNFNETIALLSGYNIVTLYARDEFGNSDEKDYKLMY